jgi:hypothetical protein
MTVPEASDPLAEPLKHKGDTTRPRGVEWVLLGAAVLLRLVNEHGGTACFRVPPQEAA